MEGNMIKRPPVIDKLLNIIEQKDIQHDENNKQEYLNFLAAAHSAQDNPDGLSLKLGWHPMNEKERNRSNCSARHSMSFFELLLMCRDFRLIPNIITKEELHYLWHLCLMEKVQEGHRYRKLISFDDFKHFLGRVAILAFNKPGMKRILQDSGGSGGSGRAFSPAELIGFLARYMHLEDIKWVRHRVRTVGRKTVGFINFKVTGEANQQNYQHLRDDLKGIRLARIMTIEDDNIVDDKTLKDFSTSTSQGTEKNVSNAAVKMNANLTKMMSIADELTEKHDNNVRDSSTSIEKDEKSFATTVHFLSKTAAQRGKGAFFGLDTISEVTKEDDVWGTHISSGHDMDMDSSSPCKDKGGSVGSVRTKVDTSITTSVVANDAFENAMQSLQTEADMTLVDLQEYLDLAEQENARHRSDGYQTKALPLPSATSPAPSLQQRNSTAQRTAQQISDGGIAIKGGLVITASQIEAVKAYSPRTDNSTRFLDRFSNSKAYFQHKSHTQSSFSEADESTCGYLDLGTLAIGTKVIIRLKVTNETAHNVKVGIHTQGLSQESASNVTTLPSMVAAGLGFIAYVAFTVERKASSYRINSNSAAGSGSGNSSTTVMQSDNILGTITLTSVWPMEPTVQSTSIYPIFFRTVPPTTMANQMKKAQLVSDILAEYPLCNPASIHRLLQGARRNIPSRSAKENQSRCGSSCSPLSSPGGEYHSVVNNNVTSNTPKNSFIEHFPPTFSMQHLRVTGDPSNRRNTEGKAIPHSAPHQPCAPTQTMSSSTMAVNTIVKRRFSMSSKVIMKRRKSQANEMFRQGDYIGL